MTMPQPSQLLKRINWRLVGRVTWLLVIAIIVYTLLPILAKMPEQAAQIVKVRWYVLLIALGVEFCSQFAGMMVLRRALVALTQPPPSYPTLLQVWFAQMAVAVLLPGGSVTATVMVADALRRRSVAPAEAATAATLSKALSIVTLVFLFVLGFVLSTGQAGSSSSYVNSVAIAMPFLILGLIALAAAIVWPRIAGALASGGAKLAARVVKKIKPAEVRSQAESIAEQSQQLLRGRKAFLTLGWSFGYWLTDAAVLYLMLWGLGSAPHIGAVLLAYTVGRLIAIIPLTPGGIGIVEVAETAILSAFGVPPAVAAVAVIAYRVFSFWLVNLVGIGAAIMLHRSGVAIKAAPEPSPAGASGN